MIEKVKSQDSQYDRNVKQGTVKTRRKEKHVQYKENLSEIKRTISDKITLRMVEAANEIGASSWLTSMPLKEHGFYLEKQAFWDSLRIRYNIPLQDLPSKCVCGLNFDIEHAFSCKKGGLISLRHNEIRDFTAGLLSECYKCSRVEPCLTPLSGESFPKSTVITDEARVDIAARGVWIEGQMAYFDVGVFNPLAKTNLDFELSSAHRQHEESKKRSYNERICLVDQGSFTPLVFSCTGGMAKECRAFYKRLSEKLSEKRNVEYSKTISWVRTRLSFHLLRSCLLCLRGSRSLYFNDDSQNVDIEFVCREADFRKIDC